MALLVGDGVMEPGNGANNISTTTPEADIDATMVKGYEHIHPDIAAMLLTRAPQDPSPAFVVDPTSLTFQIGRVGASATDVMSMDSLAALADECDRAVFAGTVDHPDLSTKILGLVRLSQLDHLEESSGENPAVLVASMMALTLLESSIRGVVMGGNNRSATMNADHPASANGTGANNKKGRGAPLLRNMIQEMSGMDHLSLKRAASSVTNPSSQVDLSASHLVPLLRALLLPTRDGGINLRNLVSHGFLYSIERRWFSLTLVLIATLDSIAASDIFFDNRMDEGSDGVDCRDGVNATTDSARNYSETSMMTKYETMAREVNHGKSVLLQPKPRLQELELQASQLVPSSHMALLRFSLHVLAPTLRQSLQLLESENEKIAPKSSGEMLACSLSSSSLTAIFTAAMCSILEHSLRVRWCQTNNRIRDRIAWPSEYYVTLDGHGQRDKHEVMITPYLSDGRTKNNLLPAIGAEASAMLADLFAAPSADAPNIRSALCHGSWDQEIAKELKCLATENRRGGSIRQEKSNALLLDAACALVSCLDLISFNIDPRSETRTSLYHPVYTYTAEATRNLHHFINDIAELDALISSNASLDRCARSMEDQRRKFCDDVRAVRADVAELEQLAYDLFPTMKKAACESWNISDAHTEHHTNVKLAGNIAALTLMGDAKAATSNFLQEVQKNVVLLQLQPNNTKERRLVKSATRFCSSAVIARDFYSFTVYMALVALHEVSSDDLSRESLLRAVERSRMAISTFDSYLSTNLDRSLKAVEQFLMGKVVKKVVHYKLTS